LLEIVQEPGIDLRELENLLNAPTELEGLGEIEDAFRVGHRELS
jgi:hypothetical protein